MIWHQHATIPGPLVTTPGAAAAAAAAAAGRGENRARKSSKYGQALRHELRGVVSTAEAQRFAQTPGQTTGAFYAAGAEWHPWDPDAWRVRGLLLQEPCCASYLRGSHGSGRVARRQEVWV
jgi:hypothetical protein